MRYALNGKSPTTKTDNHFIAQSADVIGDVVIGDNVSIWFQVVIRGDMDTITIGDDTNIQDATVIHADDGFPTTIGAGVTVGHQVMLHGCTIKDNSLIGMGATILNGAVIGANCLIGAGALVTEGKEIPDNSLVMGSPAKVVKQLTDEQIKLLKLSAQHYVNNGKRFNDELTPLD